MTDAEKAALSIDLGLAWVNTPQGHSYWSAVRMGLQAKPPSTPEPSVPSTINPQMDSNLGIRDHKAVRCAIDALRRLDIYDKARRELEDLLRGGRRPRRVSHVKRKLLLV